MHPSDRLHDIGLIGGKCKAKLSLPATGVR